jgi:hypothetical protein
MAEWLAKPRITEEDIKKSLPTLSEFFPTLVKYFVDDQKMRITVILPHEKADKFKQAVTRAFGAFGPTNINRAATEALDQWIEQHL